MPELFETIEINGLELKNRFVRSATWMGLAGDDGRCTDKLVEKIVELAEGGVGLVIAGHAFVEERGRAGPWQLGIDRDELVPALRDLTEAVHVREGRIMAQLAHSGIFGDPGLTGKTPLGPSPSDFVPYAVEEMTSRDVEGVVEAFGRAAERAKEAGFDGVQIHAAHGYLLSQFLSPAFNKREDACGGSIENRASIVMEVLHRIRAGVGKNYPVFIKINSRDFLEGGLDLEDSSVACRMLEREGIDSIEISGGTRASGKMKSSRNGISSEADEAYFEDAARVFRGEVQVPLILVGGIRSFEVAERLVKENVADFVAMSRPFIREPGLVHRWKSGEIDKASCISDTGCLVAGLDGCGIRCVVERAGDCDGKNSPGDIKEAVREVYGGVAKDELEMGGSDDPIYECMGYTEEDLCGIPEGAEMGLGCGNPLAIASLKPGEVVLDLGSGGGFDCFLAARQVGEQGRVVGVDMTDEMVNKAQENARAGGFYNVEFRLGEIENLPVTDESFDVILSNCVINLSPDKGAVFREAFRVLKPGGRLAIADIVAVAPLPRELQGHVSCVAECVAGAATVDENEEMLTTAGFQDVRVDVREESREVVRQWNPDVNLEAYILGASIEAVKPKE